MIHHHRNLSDFLILGEIKPKYNTNGLKLDRFANV